LEKARPCYGGPRVVIPVPPAARWDGAGGEDGTIVAATELMERACWSRKAWYGEQVTRAIAGRAQRPADMRGERCREQWVADAAESVAGGIRRLHQHRIGR